MGRRWLALWLLAGCFSRNHVTIPSPPPTLSPAQRVAAFERYREHQSLVEIETRCHRGACFSTRILLLNDGTRVDELEDIVPLVQPGSVTAVAATAAGRAKSRGNGWFGAFLIGGGGGLLVAGKGAGDGNAVMTDVGLGMLVVGVVGFVMFFKTSSATNKARRVAMEHYSADLAARLNICINGLVAVPCEMSTPMMPQISPRDPALDQLRKQ